MTIINEELLRSNPYMPDKDLYPTVMSLSRMSNPTSHKLLYLLHRSVTTQGIVLKKTPILEIKLALLYDYLGILGASEDPVSTLQSALYEICNSPIHILRRDKDTIHRRWQSPTWLINYQLLEKDKVLYLHLNPQISHFLSLLDALTVVRPESLQSLSRSFPNWLYICLMNASQYGDYWAIDVEEFSRLSMVDDKGSYEASNSRLGTMSQQLLGLSPTTMGKEEERQAKKEKRSIRFIAYKFITRGNLPTIRTKSELLVNAICFKVKNTLSHFVFSFREEDDNGFVGGDTSIFKKHLTFGETLAPYTTLIDSVKTFTTKEKLV